MNVSVSVNGSSRFFSLTLLSVAAMILSVTFVAWRPCLTVRRTPAPPEDPVLLRSGAYPRSRLLPKSPVIEHHGLWVVAPETQMLAPLETQAPETPMEDPQTQTSSPL
uniref:Uncharacterized protein n=1 Tax=Torque teno virus 1 TaxID=687340 RepID=A0A3S8RKM2_9VIRU|nr:hypothetical protein ORF4 [Torque teno virus 1]